MRPILLFIALVSAGFSTSAQPQDLDQRIREYIRQYKDLAMAEQVRSGIPASITLAQGIHETAAGQSRLALKAHNHFGIKCSRRWTGKTIAHTDDARNECFRRYGSAEESYRDRSHFLTSSPRYASLFQIPVTDYRGWAQGLKASGYATNPRYAERLIDLIDRYGLDQYTLWAAGQQSPAPVYFASASEGPLMEPTPRNSAVDSPIHQQKPDPVLRPGSRIRVEEDIRQENHTPPPYGTVVYVNRLKAVYAKKGDMPLEYAITHGVRYERLLSYNELDDFPLEEDMYLYLEKKHYRGLVPGHRVQEGETLRSIARKYGVQLKSLQGFNHLKPGQEPAVGALIQLQRSQGTRPPLRDPEPEPSSAPLADAKEPAMAPVGIAVQGEKGEFIDKAELEGRPASTLQSRESREAIAETVPSLPVITESDRSPQSIPVVPIGETAARDLPVQPEEREAATPDFMEGVGRIPVPSNGPDLVAEEDPAPVPSLAESPSEALVSPEPVDELDALKARFDRVIYGEKGKTAEEDPGSATLAESAESERREDLSDSTEPRFHLVKEGETVFSIARKYNITLTELQRLNNLNFDQVSPGQRLRIR